ncbi:MAG TPA: hypothetical protein VFD70_03295 [Anaerolineae bacterium]|nr:hypothetical protein [Anaerolineae bacterium]
MNSLLRSASPLKVSRVLEIVLSGVGAGIAVVNCIVIWQAVSSYQPMFPLPALYLFELIAVSVIGWLGIIYGELVALPFVGFLLWVTVGVSAAFVVLGAMSVWFFYLPVLLLFVAAGILYDVRTKRMVVLDLGVGGVAALVQAGIMLAIIQLY